ncbi:MAG: NADH-quinone oxidoreductase subunit C [Ectothiorhodospiraceae bacterium]|nr:NADH-quinone oxidoreductase subunit C [Ectothiorhodospiraceae bacterium]
MADTTHTMNEALSPIIDELKAKFGENIQDVSTFRDDTIVKVSREAIVEIVTYLRDNTTVPFPLCEDVFGIDTFERKNRFQVNYHFWSVEKKVRIHLKVEVDERDPHLPSIVGVFPGANWYEREAYDMIGVFFDNHPDHRRAYMPEDYEYYPLRKDFPMMGVPGSIPLPKRS